LTHLELPLLRKYWPGFGWPREAARAPWTEAATGGRLRVLYVSDSLGTPIHPRGIFNYSVALVEMLRAAGAKVDLVVEGGRGFGLDGPAGRLSVRAPEAANTVRLSELHRYFRDGRVGFYWGRRGRRPFLAAWQALRERLRRNRAVTVRNDASQLDFQPAESEHLALFESFVVKPGFYSSSFSRANLGLAAPALDASRYDLAIVDTPHFLKLKGLAAERIWTVIHDLIPLRDPTMDASWRQLFLRKLEATLALRGHLVFVSHHTRAQFRAAFERHEAAGEWVLYPALRRKWAAGAGPAPATLAAPEEAGRKTKRRRSRLGGRPLPPGFDPELPYFVTAVSNEPRKNIGVIVQAFRRPLRGRANMVVIGDIDAKSFPPDADANVYFPGYVSDEEKLAYFRGAQGLVFASHAEGFGIPVVEGAALGLPVICSDIAVFREIAGREAVYFDPRDPAALAAAVEQVLADPATARARAAGLRRAVLARFSQEALGADLRAALAGIGLAASA